MLSLQLQYSKPTQPDSTNDPNVVVLISICYLIVYNYNIEYFFVLYMLDVSSSDMKFLITKVELVKLFYLIHFYNSTNNKTGEICLRLKKYQA